MQIVRTLAALNDVVEIANYIALDDIQSAARFVTSVDKTYDLIQTTPFSGSPEPIANQDNLRKWLVKGFRKYAVFYSTENDEVKILRVIHTARNYKRIFNLQRRK